MSDPSPNTRDETGTLPELARAVFLADNWGVRDADVDWDNGLIPTFRIDQYFRVAEGLIPFVIRKQAEAFDAGAMAVYSAMKPDAEPFSNPYKVVTE